MLKKSKTINSIAFALIIISFLLFGLVFTVPFFPLSLTTKGIVASVMYVASELTLLLGVAIVGKQVVSQFKRYLNPFHWFSKTTNKSPEEITLRDSPIEEKE